jgi:hypothetical protein
MPKPMHIAMSFFLYMRKLMEIRQILVPGKLAL